MSTNNKIETSEAKEEKSLSSDSAQNAELLRHWDRWVETTRRVQQHRRPRISNRRYRYVHSRLLALCRTNENHTPVQDSILAIVSPWVTLDAICHAENRILRELLDECDQLNHAIRSFGFRIAKQTKQLVPLITFVAIFSVVVIQFNELTGIAYVWMAITRSRFNYAFAQLNPEQTLALLTLLVVVVGVWLTRDTRKY